MNIMNIVNNDEVEFFLTWLVEQKGLEDAKLIIDVACNPQKYNDYYQEYKESEK